MKSFPPADSSSKDTTTHVRYPLRLVVATFDMQTAARGALDALTAERAQGRITWRAATEIRRDEIGVFRIRDTAAMSTVRAALTGAAVGGLVGSLSHRARGVAVLGALVGAGLNAVVDAGIPAERLEAIARSLPNDTSSLVIVAEKGMVGRIGAVVDQRGGIYDTEPWDVGARLRRPHFHPVRVESVPRSAQNALVAGAEEMQHVAASALTQAQHLVHRLTAEAVKWRDLRGRADSSGTPDNTRS
jgi:uncharacterized membrane protein